MQSLAFLTGSRRRRAALLFGILPALLLLTLFVGSAPDAAAQTTRTITMSIAGAGPPAGFTYPTMAEGTSGQRTLRFTLDSAAPAGGIDMGSPGTAPNGNTQVISTLIAEGSTSIDYGIHANDDAMDRPNYAYVQIYPNTPNTPGVTFTVVPADRTILLTVVDNDPTEVTLTRVDTGEDTLYEGDTAQFEVSLSRPLVGAGDHGPAEVIAVPLRIVQNGDAVTTSDWSITLDEDSPNTGVSLGSSVASSGDFAYQVVTFSGAGAQTAVLKVAAENDSNQEPDEAITISLASNADFDGPTHGSATNVGGGADPHVTGSPPETDRFSLTIRDGSRPRPILFRTCPDGVTCSTSSDAGWVESDRPLVQLVEGGGQVTYQYKLTGHPTGHPDDRFGEASVSIEDTRKKGPQNVGVGLADWDRIRCHGTDDHGTMTPVGASSSILVTSATSISTTQWHDLFGGCPYHANQMSWAERDDWQTVTYSAGHDADAYDEAIVLEHRVRTTAPGGGYVYDGPPGQEGIGPTQQRRVIVPAYGPGYVDLRIVDDDDWDQEFLYSGDGGATWTKASDGGLRKAIPDELEAGATHDVHIKLLNPSLASHRSRDYIYVKVSGCGDRFIDPPCDIGVSPNSYGNDRPSAFTDLDWGTGLDVNAAANASVRLRLHVNEDAAPGTRKAISFWTHDWLGRTDTDLPDPSLRQPGPNRNTASRYISGMLYEETRVVEIVAGSEQEQALPPTLTIASAATSVTEGGDVTFTITADPAPQFDVTVNIAADEEMGSGIDLVPSSHLTTIIFPAWQSSTTWTLTTYSDEVALADGTVVGRLLPGEGYAVGAPGDPPPPTWTADPQVIAAVQALASQTQHGTAHVNRWQRALAALGALDPAGVSGGALTLDEARQNANNYSSPVWDQVVAELEAKAAFEAAQQTPQTQLPPTPEVSITSASGGTEGSNVTFTVSASPAPTADMAVSVTVATSGDYGVTAGSRTVTIAGGTTSKTLTLPTTDDSTDEADGSVTLTVNPGNGYTVGQLSSETAQVQDDDEPQQQQPATYTVDPALIAEVQGHIDAFTARNHAAGVRDWNLILDRLEGRTGMSDAKIAAWLENSKRHGWQDGIVTLPKVQAALAALAAQQTPPPTPEVNITGASGGTEGSNVTFTVSVNPAPTADLAVSVTVATAGDYGVTAGSRTVTIAGGTSSKTLTLPTTDDSTDEADGSVTLTVNPGNGYTVGQLSSETAQIQDDDEPQQQQPPQPVVTPVVSITGGSGVSEGGNASFTVTANPAPTSALSVSVTVSASGDYGATTGSRTVTIPTGGTATFTVGTTNDGNDEAAGSVIATVNAGNGYTVSSSQGAATVGVSDDDVPVVSISGGSGVTEGGDASFTVTASPVPAADLSVSVTVTASGDYGATTGQRTVTVPTTGSAVLTVGTTDDGNDESDGSVTATVNAGEGYAVSSSQGVATVSVSDDDDAPPVVTPVVSISGGSGVTEGGDASFTITASPVPAADLSVSVTVTASGDYGATTGQRTVTVPTTGSAVLTVGTTDDGNDESDGSVTATVNAGEGYAVSSSQGVATVSVSDDDDAPPVVTPVVSISGGSGVTEGGDASFTITASPVPAADLTVNVTVTASGDYGATTGSRTVTVPTTGSAVLTVGTTDDSADEADGSVTATLVDGADYDLGTDQAATVSVSDDDDAPPVQTAITISIEDASASESASDLVFRVTLSEASNEDVTVQWATGHSQSLDRARGGQGYDYDFWHARGEIVIPRRRDQRHGSRVAEPGLQGRAGRSLHGDALLPGRRDAGTRGRDHDHHRRRLMDDG